MKKLRIGLLTSGGDCQALNATMRGVVKGLAKAYLSTEPEVEEVVVKKSPKKGREKKPAVPKASEVAASIRKKELDKEFRRERL